MERVLSTRRVGYWAGWARQDPDAFAEFLTWTDKQRNRERADMLAHRRLVRLGEDERQTAEVGQDPRIPASHFAPDACRVWQTGESWALGLAWSAEEEADGLAEASDSKYARQARVRRATVLRKAKTIRADKLGYCEDRVFSILLGCGAPD